MRKLALALSLVSLAVCCSAQTIPGTVIAAKITTGSSNSTFAIGDTLEMSGTPKQVPDMPSMTNIPAARRTQGMTCYVNSTGQEWRLVGGIADVNWVLTGTSGGAGNGAGLMGLNASNLTGVSVSGPASPSATSLLIIGDSLSSWASFAYSWSADITNFPWFSGVAVSNAAVGGQTIAFATNSFYAWASSSNTTFKATNFNIVSCFVGANNYAWDTPSTIINELSNFWVSANALNCHVVAWTMLPRLTTDQYAGVRENLALINNFIRSSPLPWRVVDAAALLPNNYDPVLFQSDYTHPTALGFTNLAVEFARQVTSAYRESPKQAFGAQIGTNYVVDPPGGSASVFGPSSAAIATPMRVNGVVSANGFSTYQWYPTNDMYTVAPTLLSWWNATDYNDVGVGFGGGIPDRSGNGISLSSSSSGAMHAVDSAFYGLRGVAFQPGWMALTPSCKITNYFEFAAIVKFDPISFDGGNAGNDDWAAFIVDMNTAWFEVQWYRGLITMYQREPTTSIMSFTLPPSVTNSPILLDIVFNGSNSYMATNGVPVVNGSAALQVIATNGFAVGAMHFQIAEAMVFTNALSVPDHAAMVQTLMQRYGIATSEVRLFTPTVMGRLTVNNGIVSSGSNWLGGPTIFGLGPVGDGAMLTNLPLAALATTELSVTAPASLMGIYGNSFGPLGNINFNPGNGHMSLAGGIDTGGIFAGNGGALSNIAPSGILSAGPILTNGWNGGAVTINNNLALDYTHAFAGNQALLTNDSGRSIPNQIHDATNVLGSAAYQPTSYFDLAGAAQNATNPMPAMIRSNILNYSFPTYFSDFDLPVLGWFNNGPGVLGNLSYHPSTGTLTAQGAVTAGALSIVPNAMSAWPTAPASPGAISLVNSNGTLYELQSGAGGATWIATNLLGAVH